MIKDYSLMLYEGLCMYCNIPIEQFNKFLNISNVRHLHRGEFFIQAGQTPDKFGFVVSGILRLYYTDDEGNEFNKSFCVEGDFVASYSALLQNKESRMSIEALERTTLLTVNYNKYLELIDQHSCWHVLSRKIAEKLFIKKEQKESQFLLDHAEERYLNFKQEYPELESRINQYHIASYLGITPVALSRIRARLKDS